MINLPDYEIYLALIKFQIWYQNLTIWQKLRYFFYTSDALIEAWLDDRLPEAPQLSSDLKKRFKSQRSKGLWHGYV